jgi:hypothetical protein
VRIERGGCNVIWFPRPQCASRSVNHENRLLRLMSRLTPPISPTGSTYLPRKILSYRGGGWLGIPGPDRPVRYQRYSQILLYRRGQSGLSSRRTEDRRRPRPKLTGTRGYTSSRAGWDVWRARSGYDGKQGAVGQGWSASSRPLVARPFLAAQGRSGATTDSRRQLPRRGVMERQEGPQLDGTGINRSALGS